MEYGWSAAPCGGAPWASPKHPASKPVVGWSGRACNINPKATLAMNKSAVFIGCSAYHWREPVLQFCNSLMSAKLFRRVIVPGIVLIAVVTVVGTVLTRYWVSSPPPQATAKPKPSAEASLVDEQPLTTAQRLAALATTPEERELAQNALRLA